MSPPLGLDLRRGTSTGAANKDNTGEKSFFEERTQSHFRTVAKPRLKSRIAPRTRLLQYV